MTERRTDKDETTAMLLLAATDPKGRDIRRIIAETFAEHGTMERTAAALGLTNRGTLSHWIERLGGKVVQEKRIEFPD